ncbi:MAG TPA: alpha-2-macroglobulin family protein, partial [Bacteroidales bacterium]|nr:alpha-2-macroglobulin family protein [Bacteroidales bacterium]
RYFTLYNPASNALPRHERNWFVPMVSKAEPGDMASLLIGSSYNSVKVLFELQGKAGILKHEWITLDNEQKILEIPVREEDRGGLGVSLVFIHDNESFENSYRIDVPYSNKQLDISFASFRDKLLPGQKETWNIMIRSHEGNKVAAEMLAGMYDASLDDFKPHRWNFDLFTFRLPVNKWENSDAFGTAQGRLFQKYDPFLSVPAREYAELDWKNIYFRGFISPYYYKNQQFDGVRLAMDGETGLQGSRMEEEIAAEDAEQQNIVQQELPVSLPEAAKPSFSLRRNLQETAFFFPELRTNEAGDVIISFTMPESLTRWKMMGLAHTQDLSTAVISKELITQKDLMVVPNAPRFFRVGDEILFSARVVNLSNKELRGKARLILLDAITMKILDEEFANENAEIGFTASKGNSALVSWSLKVPEINGPVLYRVMAEAGNFSDGEETMVPVLQNRMLVTESLPLPVKGQERRDFVFEKLANMPVEGGTIRQHAYTIEFTSNPAWYAVQALPYMMDSQNECAEQVFSRAYANGLASHIMDRQPKIKNVFESWKSDNPDALLSKLENNQDLKNALLEETPWVMQARDESERKNRIALLFDLNRMEHELATSLNTLSQMQLLNGGWPWFQGGPDNRYITQYILTGFGRMLHVNALDNENAVLSGMIRNALAYADARMFEEFSRIKEEHNDYRNDNHLSQAMLQYLYMRTLFTGTYFLLEKHQEGFLYIKEQAKKYWTDYDKYLQGMIALS